jgi:hypothetical protein
MNYTLIVKTLEIRDQKVNFGEFLIYLNRLFGYYWLIFYLWVHIYYIWLSPLTP